MHTYSQLGSNREPSYPLSRCGGMWAETNNLRCKNHFPRKSLLFRNKFKTTQTSAFEFQSFTLNLWIALFIVIQRLLMFRWTIWICRLATVFINSRYLIRRAPDLRVTDWPEIATTACPLLSRPLTRPSIRAFFPYWTQIFVYRYTYVAPKYILLVVGIRLRTRSI